MFINCVGQCVRSTFSKFVGRLSRTAFMNAICVLSADIILPAKAARRLSAHVPLSHQSKGDLVSASLHDVIIISGLILGVSGTLE